MGLRSVSQVTEPKATASLAWPEAGVLSAGDFHPDPSFFDSLPGGFGPHALDLRVAGISARLTGLSARQQSELAARYGIFARKEVARERGEERSPDVEIEVHQSPRSGFLKVQRGSQPELYRLLTRRHRGALVAWSYEWAARYRLDERKAALAAASDERVVFDRCVENFLRVVFAHLALEKGGILLHGAGVVRGDRAFVFFGPSGSGKTTVTAFSAGSLILSDDLVLIVPEDQGFATSSVPFRGLLAPPATTDRRYRLAGLFRLVQDSVIFLEELSRTRAVGEIVQSLPFVTDRPEAVPRIIDVVGRLTGAVPVRRLHFRKDGGFWSVVEDV